MKTVLKGHVSPETAFVVLDYPYGFKLRCQMRYWVEYKPKLGCRVVMQSSNPKRPGLVWNKPRAGTYFRFGAALYLDSNAHVQWAGLSEYSDAAQAREFAAEYRDGVPPAAQPALDAWLRAKAVYEEVRARGADMREAAAESLKAFGFKRKEG